MQGKQPSNGQPSNINVQLKSKDDNTRRPRDPEDILVEDTRKAKVIKALRGGEKRKADIVFDTDPAFFKRPTLLPPILDERFRGTSTSSSSALPALH